MEPSERLGGRSSVLQRARGVPGGWRGAARGGGPVGVAGHGPLLLISTAERIHDHDSSSEAEGEHQRSFSGSAFNTYRCRSSRVRLKADGWFHTLLVRSVCLHSVHTVQEEHTHTHTHTHTQAYANRE